MNLNFVDLKQLRYFMEAVERGTMSGAAKRCGVSQPAMSLAIQELESRLGEQLLTRGRRGVVPTGAGRLLLHHAERLLAEESLLREQFESRSEMRSGKVNFGMIPTLAPYLLPLLLGEFRSQHPGVEIEVSENRTPELIRKIGEGEMEFAILSDVLADDQKRYGLQTRLLFEEPLLLAMPVRHEWAHREVDPEPGDLQGAEMIHLSDGHCLRDQTLQACRLSQVELGLQCDQLETALAMVAANLGMAVVPKLALRGRMPEQVVVRSFAKPSPKRKVYLLKKKGTKLTKPAEQLVKVLVSDAWQG
ncbi:MAG: LysR family transcriptional regulator [Verrucomicrobiaceae bacterium]